MEQPVQRENGSEGVKDSTEGVMETANSEAKDTGHQVKQKIEIEVSVLQSLLLNTLIGESPSHSHLSAAASAGSSWTTLASGSSWGTPRMP